MTNISMLVVCLLVGMILCKTRRVPDNAHVPINAFIIHVALPALILGQIQLMVGVGIALSFVTLPRWYLGLGWI